MKQKSNKTADQAKVAESKDYITEKCAVFGENMRIARKERGFTSEALARFLEISTAYVGLIERGERCPSLETFLKICDFFGESPENMLNPRSVLSVAEKKPVINGENAREQVKRKQKMITSMISTFNIDELNFLISAVKSFKNFSQLKQADLNTESGDIRGA